MQTIRSAQEKFRTAIRMTAPKFRPFERKFKGTRHLDQAKFLRSEEGDEWDEGGESESESDDEAPPEPVAVAPASLKQERNEDESDSESHPEPQAVTPASKKRKRNEGESNDAPVSKKRKSGEIGSSKVIYIDQVMERASR